MKNKRNVLKLLHNAKQYLTTLAFLSLLALLTSCDQFEFSPNQSFDHSSPSNLNAQNLARLRQNAEDDTVTIVFAGDTQRWYDEQERFVKKVNSLTNVDLVLLAGDISDFGLLQEFKWVQKRLSALRAPYFGIIGNHDMVANGRQIFRQMFGPLNYSFVYGGIKFIAHNTNGLEAPGENIPDLGWLSRELRNMEGASYMVTVSHVPPFNALEFGPAAVKPYTDLLRNAPNLLLSLHGHVHLHQDFYPFGDRVHYITSFSFKQSAFVLLQIVDGKVLKSIINY
ncbi:phosphoesterase [Dyadobacter endophyticus]|uniref:Phosphoesterase n=1 Tax=Dyadobacter endophyticus TaxID=1749036 RepID=A0ABQ1YM56_9BACT|nr:metallophosphoesterase [Dyadobacter endophyticus]GGH29203.1 phosphoesterase [Dyadobacter endophyticus]